MRWVALLFCCLGGCAQLPDTPTAGQTSARAAAFPVLVPLDDVLAEAERPSRAQAAQDELRARGARLSDQRVLPPVTGDLAERGRRLRARADALRAQQI